MIKVLEGTIHDIQSVRNILEILYPNPKSAGWYHTPPARQNDANGWLWLAQLEGQIVGFTHFWTSEWHPQTDYVTMGVLHTILWLWQCSRV